MRHHLHLLEILQLVWGGLGLLLGVVVLLLAIGAVAIGIGAPDERMAAGLTAAGFVVFALALLAGGAANAWAGRALRRRQPAGRTVTLWLAVLNLFVLPFGTALGIYAFWVLLHNDNRARFLGPGDWPRRPMPGGHEPSQGLGAQGDGRVAH
jgi:hypothetical protein